jgi:ubiquinone/menaquinone biosynthesis C-methylase UbiE
MDLASQRAFWDGAAAEKRFQHPLRADWLAQHMAGRVILDCGCGYGRLLSELAKSEQWDVVGTDFSVGMLKRCTADGSRLFRLVQSDGRMLPFRDRSFDGVLLFTLLTCMPWDSQQRELLSEVKRVLRPRGLVYISDLLLNTDARNVERYERFANECGSYGTFKLSEGAVVRHHREEWIRLLTYGFTQLQYEQFVVTTMNGNHSAAFQFLGRLSKDDRSLVG